MNASISHRKVRKAMSDLISRQAAIEALTGWETEPSDEDIVRELKNLPSVTPTERTGEWIENAPEGQDIDPPYICSICGHAESTRTPFCEQCGADMRGDEDE